MLPRSVGGGQEKTAALKLLIVEDDPSIQDLLAQFISGTGWPATASKPFPSGNPVNSTPFMTKPFAKDKTLQGIRRVCLLIWDFR
jgi:hypothetical protein